MVGGAAGQGPCNGQQVVYQCQPALTGDLADDCQAPECGSERPGASGGSERLTIRRLEYDQRYNESQR